MSQQPRPKTATKATPKAKTALDTKKEFEELSKPETLKKAKKRAQKGIKVPESGRVRGWCFTLNHYTESEWEFFKAVVVGELFKVKEKEFIKYAVVGKEVGEKCGTPHLQGYIEFKNVQSRAWCRKHISDKAHWGERYRTPEEAANYCMKDGDYVQNGVLPMENGKRRGLAEATRLVMKGTPIEDVINDYPTEFVRYGSGLRALSTMKIKQRDPNNPPTVRWLWGPAGTGKTRSAYNSHKTVYIKDGTQWWDGYEGQEAIIIDDFDDAAWNYRDFLRLLDRYPYKGQFKGGYVNINSPYIYITCEFSPNSLWSGNKLAQVTRRLTQTTLITKDGAIPEFCTRSNEICTNAQGQLVQNEMLGLDRHELVCSPEGPRGSSTLFAQGERSNTVPEACPPGGPTFKYINGTIVPMINTGGVASPPLKPPPWE